MQLHQAFCCLRPGTDGQWFIQNDVDHAPHGIHSLGVIQTATSLKVYFDPVFVKVGALQILPDDGFKGSVVAGASFGKEVAAIELNVWPFVRGFDDPISPADIWSKLDAIAPPNKPAPRDNGNLWCVFHGWIA